MAPAQRPPAPPGWKQAAQHAGSPFRSVGLSRKHWIIAGMVSAVVVILVCWPIARKVASAIDPDIRAIYRFIEENGAAGNAEFSDFQKLDTLDFHQNIRKPGRPRRFVRASGRMKDGIFGTWCREDVVFEIKNGIAELVWVDIGSERTIDRKWKRLEEGWMPEDPRMKWETVEGDIRRENSRQFQDGARQGMWRPINTSL
ncbi:MAG TPA: hypothetical protein VG125_11205 [Pirellulales bacterium]|nr:hypothetical protein [Pirellulales bacterium]